MKILCIDYGRHKIGLALSVNGFSEPLKVLHIKFTKDAIAKVLEQVGIEAPDKIIVGVSECPMGLESKQFSEELQKKVRVSVETYDETLTSQDAQRLSREAGVGQKKRKEMEDAYAASVMLQYYIDNN